MWNSFSSLDSDVVASHKKMISTQGSVPVRVLKFYVLYILLYFINHTLVSQPSASHFVARNREEEEVSSARIVGDKSALSDVLEEVSFAGVFAGEFPWRVKIRFRISIGIHEHLELLLHLLVV
ncbi:hypothetical protein V8G54_034516 [Vigna mungo]|uniref:Uncharacterized protein n=1 Tax=Vigna mungo TaxID=3915 RepID=A0AAQ3RK28_VIGMU